MRDVIVFWGPVLIISAILVFITILLMKKFKKRKYAPYIPTVVIWLVSITFLIKAIFFSQPMEDLGYFVMSMIAGVTTFITLIITIVLVKYINRKR